MTPAVRAGGASRAGVREVKGIGPRVAERLSQLGIRTVEDLVFHLPARYEDRTRVVSIGSLRAAGAVVVSGTIERSEVKYGRRRSLVCELCDDTGRLVLRFFHFNESQRSRLRPSTRLRCYAQVRQGPTGLEMVHPEYEVLDAREPIEVEEHLTPVYPATEGLTQPALRRYVGAALELLGGQDRLPELLPEEVLERLGFPHLDEALAFVHRPPPDTCSAGLETGALPAQRRLSFEELLAHHLSLKMVRRRLDTRHAPKISGGGALSGRFLRSLPFEPTTAQRRVIAEITADLATSHPMYRLLQGDVGSGKTLVAGVCALETIEAGHQVALMAPTELLAEQHLRTFESWFSPLDVTVTWLSGQLTARQRKGALIGLAEGGPRLAIGTHALFQDGVAFNRLGLVIVDEQHRFGVGQRLALRAKGARGEHHPHQLVMTATPIPRTLAMTAYADLDSSVVDELPPGRTAVETAVIPQRRRAEVVERVRRACAQGRQVYWVCPLIDESDALQLRAAADVAESLRTALEELSIGLVHGRMRPGDQDEVMRGFAGGVVQVLVATTVVEVGVDVPNASLMVIENAERMGLAQLHQLRGRVGRGTAKSVCLLLYQAPLSRAARLRLGVIRASSNGFEVAERDLELRGPGEVLGTRQTGLPQLKIADLGRDRALFASLGPMAAMILERYPERIRPIVERWIGDAVDYAGV